MNENAQEEIAVLKTSKGTIALRFFSDIAPLHVDNFKNLARENFYDGLLFHRVIAGFMIQGGCPNTREDRIYAWGTGGPGHTVKAEFSDRPHTKGTLSMARGKDPDSAGSQFFICHGDAAFLDGQYTVFGEVMDGLDVVDTIAEAEVETNSSGESSMPVEPVEVESVTIVSLAEYQPSSS